MTTWVCDRGHTCSGPQCDDCLELDAAQLLEKTQRGPCYPEHGIAAQPWTEYGTRAAGSPAWKCLSAVCPTRIDVYVERPMLTGWMLAYNPPAWALSPEVALLRCVERYQRWCQSLRRRTVRAQAVQAHAARLLMNGHVVALCGDEQTCKLYGIAAEVVGSLEEADT